MAKPTAMLTCPRCGYDVSGVVPTWAEQCPLEGRCSECGLGFAWVDIYRPERLHPAWSFEHVTRRRVRAFFKSVCIALRPKKLWREMSMAAPIRAGRLAFMVGLLVLLTHLASGGLEWAKVYLPAFRLGWPGLRFIPGTYWMEFGKTMAWPYGGLFGTKLLGPFMRLLVLWGAIIPLPYLLLVDTMKQAKCRRAHLARGWAYFVPVVCISAIVGEAFPNLPWMVTAFAWPLSVFQTWNGFIQLLGVLAIIWYVRWWWHFTHMYLRLPQARLVLALLLAISLLTTLALGLLFDPEQIDLLGSAINYFLG